MPARELNGLLDQENIKKIASDSGIITQDEDLLRSVKLAFIAASENVPVLITGETGVGKELFANLIYNRSREICKKLSQKQLYNDSFGTINCGAIPTELVESEFFGHEKGSFTGAASQRQGIFETHDKGTVFLDEIGDLPLNQQQKLLRVLEGHPFRRVGGNTDIQTQFRIVAATNVNLHAAVKQKKFREDLLYRLNDISIPIKPLREREGDIKLLTRHFFDKYTKQFHQTDLTLGQDVIPYLSKQEWPGNVRQLEKAIKSAVLLCDTDEVSVDTFKQHALADISDDLKADSDTNDTLSVKSNGSFSSPHLLHQQNPVALLIEEMLDKGSSLQGISSYFRSLTCSVALYRSGGNKTKTAKALQIDRKSLYNFMTLEASREKTSEPA